MRSEVPTLNSGDLQQKIRELQPWFHNLHLPGGLQTAPDHPLGDFPAYKWQELEGSLPQDLTGWTALDIGCNAGFYTFQLARRGADVVGIDVNSHYLEQARWAAGVYRLEDRVEFRQQQVYDLARSSERFDLVLFMGVFYHLRYPLLGLDIVSEKIKRLLVFQTLTLPGEEVAPELNDQEINRREAMLDPGWPKMAFVEHRIAGDPTNWWAANHSGVLAMLRSCGLRVISKPGHELYVCRPDPETPSSAATWNRDEFLAATGQLPNMDSK